MDQYYIVSIGENLYRLGKVSNKGKTVTIMPTSYNVMQKAYNEIKKLSDFDIIRFACIRKE